MKTNNRRDGSELTDTHTDYRKKINQVEIYLEKVFECQ